VGNLAGKSGVSLSSDRGPLIARCRDDVKSVVAEMDALVSSVECKVSSRTTCKGVPLIPELRVQRWCARKAKDLPSMVGNVLIALSCMMSEEF